MNLGIWYWLLMALWLLFGLIFFWPASYGSVVVWYPLGGNLLLFILLLILGIQVFGSPVKRSPQ